MIDLDRAIVYTYTEVFSSSVDFQNCTPYVSGIAEAADGTRFPVFLIGKAGDAIEIGTEVVYVKHSADNIPIYRFP